MALQEFVKKVFSDEQPKQQFLADPKGVISHFALTEKEKSAVLKTHASFGIVTSSSPRWKRLLVLPLNGWRLFRCRKGITFLGWEEWQSELLKSEIEALLAPLFGVDGLYDLVREPLTKVRRGVAVEAAQDRPWPLLPLLVSEAVSGQYERALPVAAAFLPCPAGGKNESAPEPSHLSHLSSASCHPGAFSLMDGNEVCRLVKANPGNARTKVLMLSGMAQRTDAQMSRKNGADAYMTKPFSPAALAVKLEELLG